MWYVSFAGQRASECKSLLMLLMLLLLPAAAAAAPAAAPSDIVVAMTGAFAFF